jgi:hypothetical protein
MDRASWCTNMVSLLCTLFVGIALSIIKTFLTYFVEVIISAVFIYCSLCIKSYRNKYYLQECDVMLSGGSLRVFQVNGNIPTTRGSQ